MSEYPRDRFDDVPEYTDRKGGHRAHFDPPVEASGLRWIGIAAALALAIGAFCFFILPGLLSSSPNSASADESRPAASSAVSSSAAVSPSSTPDDDDASSPSGSSTSGSSPSSTGSSAPARATPTAAASASTTPAAAPSAVEVYNASGIGGLAGSTRDQLTGAGFQVGGVGDWQGFPVSRTAVYYSSGAQTARAVAAQLGIPAVYDARVPGVVVILAGSR